MTASRSWYENFESLTVDPALAALPKKALNEAEIRALFVSHARQIAAHHKVGGRASQIAGYLDIFNIVNSAITALLTTGGYRQLASSKSVTTKKFLAEMERASHMTALSLDNIPVIQSVVERDLFALAKKYLKLILSPDVSYSDSAINLVFKWYSSRIKGIKTTFLPTLDDRMRSFDHEEEAKKAASSSIVTDTVITPSVTRVPTPIDSFPHLNEETKATPPASVPSFSAVGKGSSAFWQEIPPSQSSDQSASSPKPMMKK